MEGSGVKTCIKDRQINEKNNSSNTGRDEGRGTRDEVRSAAVQSSKRATQKDPLVSIGIHPLRPFAAFGMTVFK